MARNPAAVSLIRGGTSKGVYVRLRDLPPAGPQRDAFALGLLGSPDPMQLDGLGGTYSSTSKLMAIGTPQEARAYGYDVPGDIDVAYLFGQIAINDPIVDWRGTCGNLTAGVPLYAVDEGMVSAHAPVTALELLNLNTGVRVASKIPVREDGHPELEGDFAIAGVPGTGPRIDLDFRDPAKGLTGALLPTGSILDHLDLDGVAVPATILDVTNPVVVVNAHHIGLAGTELPTELNRRPDVLAHIEQLRGRAAVCCGFVANAAVAAQLSPAVPRVIICSPPAEHVTVAGDVLMDGDCDVVVRNSSMGVIHHAFTGSGLMAAAVAALLPGSVLNAVSKAASTEVRLAHPKGVVTVSADIATAPEGPVVRSVSIPRTARRLMTGLAYPSPASPTAEQLARHVASPA